jgi:light-regulated signal transduction histidine kinase (bacteriophytochrome)
MGELIEAILKLSHVTRTGILCKEVNLSNIACDVANNLQKEYPLRKVTFTIQPDLIASGDPKLLEVVLVNLMNNAWKFTSKTKEARIEFGLKLIDDEYQYYLKDNGAGFEMSYASKLFGAFQRLHNEKEFPGTGIGLATVQRIINRHNGTIRAESEVNNGATFYFTIKEA